MSAHPAHPHTYITKQEIISSNRDKKLYKHEQNVIQFEGYVRSTCYRNFVFTREKMYAKNMYIHTYIHINWIVPLRLPSSHQTHLDVFQMNVSDSTSSSFRLLPVGKRDDGF